jgi:hypothetical protein
VLSGRTFGFTDETDSEMVGLALAAKVVTEVIGNDADQVGLGCGMAEVRLADKGKHDQFSHNVDFFDFMRVGLSYFTALS